MSNKECFTRSRLELSHRSTTLSDVVESMGLSKDIDCSERTVAVLPKGQIKDELHALERFPEPRRRHGIDSNAIPPGLFAPTFPIDRLYLPKTTSRYCSGFPDGGIGCFSVDWDSSPREKFYKSNLSQYRVSPHAPSSLGEDF